MRDMFTMFIIVFFIDCEDERQNEKSVPNIRSDT